jgi:muramoyltetrapeptide carboxypeptidase
MFKPLKKNSTIGIISPAYIPVPERVEKGMAYLQQKGMRIKTGKYLQDEHGYFAGTDQQRLADLHAMFADPEVDMIICTRGGWGGLRLIDRLDYGLIESHPKPLVGYSDITTLQLAIWNRCGLASFSGPMVGVEMGKGIDPFTETHFWEQIRNTEAVYSFNYAQTDTILLTPGNAEGILLGGCLSLVTSLLGTPYVPDYKGAILFIEDVGEQPYKIDRYLAHLRQAGIFEQISGLILGEFLDCQADEGDKSFTIDEILSDYFSGLHIPVLKNFPYGHGDKKVSMPVGMNVEIDTGNQILRLQNPFYQ